MPKVIVIERRGSPFAAEDRARLNATPEGRAYLKLRSRRGVEIDFSPLASLPPEKAAKLARRIIRYEREWRRARARKRLTSRSRSATAIRLRLRQELFGG